MIRPVLGGGYQRIIKLAKLDVKIVLRERDEETKFELFQRLNTGGTSLSAQEVRNCLIIMVSPEGHKWLQKLAKYENFRRCLALSEQAVEKQYQLELVIRFLVFRRLGKTRVGKIGDLGSFLDNKIVAKLKSPKFNQEHEEKIFHNTFDALADSLEDSSFRRYYPEKNKFMGGFLISAFEVLALGLGYHFGYENYQPPDITEIAKSLWTDPKFTSGIGSGVNVRKRLEFTIHSGRKLLTT